MPLASALQIPPPAHWQDFESLSHALWSRIWNDPDTQKNGRSGQRQHGVDVFGRPNRKSVWAGVQCKGKDNYNSKPLTEGEIKNEIVKATEFSPPLSEFIFATTGPKDAGLEQLARHITNRHLEEGLFSVTIKGWADILADLEGHDDLIEQYCSVQVAGSRIISEVGNRIEMLRQDLKTLLKQQASEPESLEIRSRFDTRTHEGRLLHFRHNAQIATCRFFKGVYPNAVITQDDFPNDNQFIVEFQDGINLHAYVLAQFHASAVDVEALVRFIEKYKERDVMSQQLGVFVTGRESFNHLVDYFDKLPRYGTHFAIATIGNNSTFSNWRYLP